jgi:protein-disulfide isomerase
MLFANQNGEGKGAFTDRRLKAFAGALVLDQAKFDACFDSHKYASVVSFDKALGEQMGVTQTPTMFINGVKVTNPLDYTEIKQRLDLILQ